MPLWEDSSQSSSPGTLLWRSALHLVTGLLRLSYGDEVVTWVTLCPAAPKSISKDGLIDSLGGQQDYMIHAKVNPMQVLDTIGFSVLSSLHPHEMDGIEVEAKNMNGATDEHLSGALCYSLVVGSSSILHAHRMLWMEKKKTGGSHGFLELQIQSGSLIQSV